MNNPKLIGIVEQFSDSYNISFDNDNNNDGLAHKYEMFANYLIMKKSYFDINGSYPYESIFDIDLLYDIYFGEYETMAADGCFIIAGKDILHLKMDEDELNDRLDKITEGTISVVLIQTKSGNLATEALSTLSNCLQEDFSGQNNWKNFINFKRKYEKIRGCTMYLKQLLFY